MSERSNDPLVALVDDDSAVREALGDLLNSVGIDTVAFASADEYLELSTADRPGCLVLDVRMPGLSGLDLQNQLAELGRGRPIVFLTGHGDIAMSVQAMKAGAVDFLTKPVRDQTFLDAVSRAIEADVTRRATANQTQRYVELYATLTPRERQVLRFVVKGSLNKQIAFELKISEVTVKLHRSSMMKKLNASSTAHLFAIWQSLPTGTRTSGA
jgi:FixJ family two-component response regulator